jgi:hypothetical protein
MLVIQVLMTWLFGIENFRFPASFFHNPFYAEDSLLVMVVRVKVVKIFNQVSVFNVAPPVSFPDTWYVPSGPEPDYYHKLIKLY